MWWLLIPAAIVVIVLVVIVRALVFKPEQTSTVDTQPIEFDRDTAIENLRQLIRCKTVSYRDKSLEDDSEFEKLISLLPKLYPSVFQTCSFTQLPDRALLFHWKGNVLLPL